MSEREEKEAVDLYKGYLQETLRDPQVVREKKQFIDAYFKEEPFWARGLGYLVPAASLIVLLFFAVHLYMPADRPLSVEKTGPKLEEGTGIRAEKRAAQTTAQDKTAPALETVPIKPVSSVEVKKATSETGPVMVYQKTHQSHPITIIWVFSGG